MSNKSGVNTSALILACCLFFFCCNTTPVASASTNRSTSITYSFVPPPNPSNHRNSARRAAAPNSRNFYADAPDVRPKKGEEPGGEMRAWSCHGQSQRDLVDRLMEANIVKVESVRDVLYRVDRQNFAPAGDGSKNHNSPYMDTPQPIGLGQTISAPHMHAHVLEEMYPFLIKNPTSKMKILDVGCGSGYLTAALGRWVAPIAGNNRSGSLLGPYKTGKVYGIDIYPHLLDLSRNNIMKEDKDLLDNSVVSLSVTDGWKGLPGISPFDAIHVGAAAAEFPRALLEQLKVGGVLIIPVGPEGGVQNLYRVERLSDGFMQEDYRITELLGVRYVPLVQQQSSEQDVLN